MSLLRSKSSSSILIKRKVQKGQKKQSLLKIREQHAKDNRHPVSILYPEILADPAHTLNPFSETNVILHTAISASL